MFKILIGFFAYIVAEPALAEPVTAFVAANAGVFSAIGTAVSVIGALSGASASQNAAEYNKKVAENNAIAARQTAAANAEAQSRRARLQQGKLEAAYGASGVSASEGSALDILEQSARDAEFDRLNILYGGEVRAAGYGAEANLQNSRANDTSGYWSAGGALLSGVAKAGQLTRDPGTSYSAPSFSSPIAYGGTSDYSYIDNDAVKY